MYTAHRHLILAKITDIRSSTVLYEACIDCYTKVLLDDTLNKWVCIKCGRQYSTPSLRYRVALCINDGTSTCTTTVFGKNLDDVFGASAKEFHRCINKDGSNPCPQSLLTDALYAVLMGKMFYFGFRVSITRPKGSVKGISLEEITTAMNLVDSSDRELQGLVAYQMLASTKDKSETVINFLRNSRRNFVREGQPKVADSGEDFLCRQFNCTANHRCIGKEQDETRDQTLSVTIPTDDQSTLALSCDTTSFRTISRSMTSNRHKAEDISYLQSSLTRNTTDSVHRSSSIHILPINTSSNVSTRDPDETIDLSARFHASLEQIRGSSQPGTSQLVLNQLSLVEGIDFDNSEGFDKPNLLSPSHSVLPTADADLSELEEDQLEDEADCSSFLIPLEDLRDQNGTQQSTSSSMEESVKLSQHSDNIAESSSKETPTNWDTLPESEDLEEFLNNLDQAEESAPSRVKPSHVKPQELSGVELGKDGDLDFGSSIDLPSTVSSKPDCHAQVSLLEDAPFSEDLDAFLSDWPRSEKSSTETTSQRKGNLNASRLIQQESSCRTHDLHVEQQAETDKDHLYPEDKISLVENAPFSEDLDAFLGDWEEESNKELDDSETTQDVFCDSMDSDKPSEYFFAKPAEVKLPQGPKTVLIDSEQEESSISASVTSPSPVKEKFELWSSDCVQTSVACSNDGDVTADGSCDLFDQSEDLFESSGSRDLSTVMDSMSEVRNSTDVCNPRRKSVHFPSASQLAESENISSIDRKMERNSEGFNTPTVMPTKPCLRISDSFSAQDWNVVQPDDRSVTKATRTIADLFKVTETPQVIRNGSSCEKHEGLEWTVHRSSPTGFLDTSNNASFVPGSQDLFGDCSSLSEPPSSDHVSTPITNLTTGVLDLSLGKRTDSSVNDSVFYNSSCLFDSEALFSGDEDDLLRSVTASMHVLSVHGHADMSDSSQLSQDLFD